MENAGAVGRTRATRGISATTTKNGACRCTTTAVGNAAAFAAIRQEFGSFDSYLWQWTGGKTLVECGPTTSPLSDAISKDLKKRGMKFVGSTIIYAYLQAVGVLYAHEPGCFLEAAP